MKYDEDAEDDIYTLKTGRRLYANRGILGVGPDLKLYEGYDGDVYDLTPEEIVEVADHAIELWQRVKTEAGATPPADHNI